MTRACQFADDKYHPFCGQRQVCGDVVDFDRQAQVERVVTSCIQDSFFFAVIPVEARETRLSLEARIISTVSLCLECRPSGEWLGLHSPKRKIQESGLWQVNQLYKEPMSQSNFEWLQTILR
jgi:hypothetical protein